MTVYTVPRLLDEKNVCGYRRISGVLKRDTEVSPKPGEFDVRTPGYEWSEAEISALNAVEHKVEVE